MAAYNDDLTVLINCLATTFGDEVGQAVQDKFDQIFALEAADINAISAQIATLNALLASNTAGDQLTAQSILTQLAALDSRLDVLEGDTRITTLEGVVAVIQAAIATEAADRAAADAGLQTSIDSISTALSQLSQVVVSIQNSIPTGGDCDCAALTTAIADQANAIANLQATDSAQAVQIAALQATVATLSASAASIATAQATADAAAATAQSALSAAAAAQATATAAASAAAAAQADVDALEVAQGNINNTFVTKLEIQNINCSVLGNAFRGAMRSRMFAVGDPHRN